MIDFELDPVTNDIKVTGGRTYWTDRIEVLTKQRVYITLNTNRGEWVYNIDFGVPWLKNPNNPIQIFGKTPKNIVDAYIKEAILSKDEVNRIEYYESTVDPHTRILTVEFMAETQSGEIVVGSTALQT